MALYIFILHVAGDDATRTEVECADDSEALQAAKHLTRLCDVDVWKDGLVLGSLQRRPRFAKAC